MAANILHQVPGFVANRGAFLPSKSELSFSFSSARNVKGGTSQIYAPLTAASISGSGCIGLSSVTRSNNVIVYAQSATIVSESEDEGDTQSEAETTLEVSEEEFKPSPRKPRIKLGEIMGILNKRAVEAAEKERPTPDIRTGDIVELRMEVPETRRRVSVYKGIVMSRQNAGIHTTFRIRRIIAGVGVEIVFPLYSPNLKEIKVVKHRKVRRARLYYLRNKLPRLSTFK
eukprot:Gb_05695 [translate_table: standard]